MLRNKIIIAANSENIANTFFISLSPVPLHILAQGEDSLDTYYPILSFRGTFLLLDMQGKR